MENYTELRKIDCVDCNGQGCTYTESKTQCNFCYGRGWHEPEEGDEALCPECNGYGFVFEEEKQECPKCLGKGYFIHIFEIVPKSVTCHKCDGVGTIYEHDKCESCFGFGFSVEDNVAAKGCPVCASSGNVKGDRCEKCGGLGLVDFATGEKLSSDQDCPDCDGKGYREIPEECSECSGTGEIIEIDTEVEITPTMNQP